MNFVAKKFCINGLRTDPDMVIVDLVQIL
jgi:hypothetical protein